MSNTWKNLVPVEIGKWTGTGDTITLDLACVKSVLIGGEFGSGKSCLIRHILATLTREHTPEEVRLLIADPKIVEYSDYEDSPYLLRPVVTDAEYMRKRLTGFLRNTSAALIFSENTDAETSPRLTKRFARERFLKKSCRTSFSLLMNLRIF